MINYIFIEMGNGYVVAYLNFDDNDAFIKLIETEFEKNA